MSHTVCMQMYDLLKGLQRKKTKLTAKTAKKIFFCHNSSTSKLKPYFSNVLNCVAFIRVLFLCMQLIDQSCMQCNYHHP